MQLYVAAVRSAIIGTCPFHPALLSAMASNTGEKSTCTSAVYKAARTEWGTLFTCMGQSTVRPDETQGARLSKKRENVGSSTPSLGFLLFRDGLQQNGELLREPSSPKTETDEFTLCAKVAYRKMSSFCRPRSVSFRPARPVLTDWSCDFSSKFGQAYLRVT